MNRLTYPRVVAAVLALAWLALLGCLAGGALGWWPL